MKPASAMGKQRLQARRPAAPAEIRRGHSSVTALEKVIGWAWIQRNNAVVFKARRSLRLSACAQPPYSVLMLIT